MKKVILYELNEVPIKILDHYRKVRPNSWIARNHGRLKHFETYSENKGHLSPWNTWPTLHRGVNNEKHFITDFNQNLTEVDREFPPIWEILTRKGVKVGVFGSLHSYPLPKDLENYAFYIPDVFAAGSECFPHDIEIFQDFNLRMSRASSRNVDRKVPFADALKLLANVNKLGFRAGTMVDTAKQLLEEKITPWKAVRRRTYQTIIGFDVFYKLLNKTKPDFVTFFTNHVASSMHRYWAASFPDEYDNLLYDDQWIGTYNQEIIWTMDQTDQMLQTLSKFVDNNPEYSLVITSSMGQEAIECEPIETQLYITNHERFMNMMGISQKDQYKVLPAMLPQFNYEIHPDQRSAFTSRLKALKINGKPIEFRELHDTISIDLGQRNLKSTTFELNGATVAFEDSGLENVTIEDMSSATAYHIPNGHMMVYNPSVPMANGIVSTAIPTTEITSALVQNFGVNAPAYMPRTEHQLV